MSLRAAILGLVALRPQSGYELKKTFDRSMYYIWNATGSQIYTILSALRKEGLLTVETIQQDGRPNRHIHSITPAGLEGLQAYLTEPLEQRAVRDEELLQVFLSNFIDEEKAQHNLNALLERIRNEREYLARVRDRVVGHPGDSHRARYYQLCSLRLKLAQLDAMATELQRAIVEDSGSDTAAQPETAV